MSELNFTGNELYENNYRTFLLLDPLDRKNIHQEAQARLEERPDEEWATSADSQQRYYEAISTVIEDLMGVS